MGSGAWHQHQEGRHLHNWRKNRGVPWTLSGAFVQPQQLRPEVALEPTLGNGGVAGIICQACPDAHGTEGGGGGSNRGSHRGAFTQRWAKWAPGRGGYTVATRGGLFPAQVSRWHGSS